jgi:Ethanolamine utilization protein EutJ (predicted chaperonin)
MVRLLLTLVVLCAAGASFAQGEDKPPEDSIQVEVRGTLETGVVAIGGETTGTIIKAGNVTWELDLSGDPKLADAAKNLNKQKVVVAGTYQKKQGVEVAERHIVTVKSLQAADAK